MSCPASNLVNQYPNTRQLATVWLALFFLAGCGQRSPEVLTTDKIPGVMNQAFGQATGETKDMAAQVVTACQKQDTVSAFAGLQALAHKPELTMEERAAASRAMVSTLQQLQTASAKGDAAAKAAVQHYLSTR